MDFKSDIQPARKIMVVADSTRESVEALEYTLSHVLVEKDELILIHVADSNSWKNSFATFLRRSSLSSSSAAAAFPFFSSYEEAAGDMDFIEEMKHACKVAQPKVRVHIVRVQTDASNKAATILYKTEMLGVALLVVGQRRSLSNVIPRLKMPGGAPRVTKWMDIAEHLIENSKCFCVGVQKKSQNAGYLLNTKTRKNFWILA